MILVLVPVLFEIFFLAAFAGMFLAAVGDFNGLEKEKEALVIANQQGTATAHVILSTWQALEVKTLDKKEVVLRNMKNFTDLMAMHRRNRMRESEPPELRELIDEAHAIGFDASQIIAQTAADISSQEGPVTSRIITRSDRNKFFATMLRLEELSKRMNVAQSRIRRDEPGKLRVIRYTAIGLLIAGILVSCTISIWLSVFFSRDILERLRSIANNAYLLAAGKPLPPVQAGSDEIAQLDMVLHDTDIILGDARRKELAVLDNAADVICSVDSNLRFVITGAATEKVWQYAPDDLLGKSVLTMVAPDSAEKTRKAFLALAESGEEGEFENIVLCRDGTPKNSQWTIKWFNEEKNYFCVVHDITDLRAVEKLKQNFLSMVSHDLRAPLNAVGISLAILLSGKRGALEPETRKNLKKVEQSMSRLMELINELLELEKLESGRLTMTLSAVRATKVCQTARDSLDAMALKAGVALRGPAPADDIWVLGEERRLVQVLINLLSNAIKFSPRGSTIDIELIPSAQEVEFSIKDEGPGIPPEQRALIFDKFRQARTVPNMDVKSTGLGLAIVKAIIDAHNGSLGVKSDIGKGSTFWFKINRAQPDGRP